MCIVIYLCMFLFLKLVWNKNLSLISSAYSTSWTALNIKLTMVFPNHLPKGNRSGEAHATEQEEHGSFQTPLSFAEIFYNPRKKWIYIIPQPNAFGFLNCYVVKIILHCIMPSQKSIKIYVWCKNMFNEITWEINYQAPKTVIRSLDAE